MAKPKILFIHNSEYGLSNCHRAVIASLQEHHGQDVDIHVASYEPFRTRIPAGVEFHCISGHGLFSHYVEPPDETGKSKNSITYTLIGVGFFNAMRSFSRMMNIVHPESPEQYVATAKSVERLLNEIKPTLAVIDNLQSAARDGAEKSGQDYVLLSANTVKEVATQDQGAGIFWWPVTGTGYPFPLPWYLLVPNMIVLFALSIWLFLIDPNYKAKQAARRAAGYDGQIPNFTKRKTPILCMSHPAVEWPVKIPEDVICSGPILNPCRPLADVDPELFQWLSERPTVLIALGSLRGLTRVEADAMLGACRALLDKRMDVQILWKLQKWGEYEVDPLDERVKIVNWLNADPLSVLETGNVVCFINHGGSNSYHEALSTGVPQVILSPWYDCHDLANKAEYHGVGKWANKYSAPGINQHELTAALLSVVGATSDSEEASTFRQRAHRVAALLNEPRAESPRSREKGELSERLYRGRDYAAEWLWQRAQSFIEKST